MPFKERKLTFRDKLTQNKYLTFASLFEVKQSDHKTGKAKTVKADRNILQRLITAYEAGRPVDLKNIMRHELFVVPLSLAEVNGQLRSGSKEILATILTSDIACPNHLEARDLQGETTLIIDGQALVIATGKPQGPKTFGDLQMSLLDLFSKVEHSSNELMSCLIATTSTISKVEHGNDVEEAQWQLGDQLQAGICHFLKSG